MKIIGGENKTTKGKRRQDKRTCQYFIIIFDVNFWHRYQLVINIRLRNSEKPVTRGKKLLGFLFKMTHKIGI